MNSDILKEEINKTFPNAEIGRIFFAKQSILLEEKYGFTPENTRFAEGGCCDEINEPEYQFMESRWKARFKFGGLAGYCHGGRTGLNAVSHHVPEVDGQKNLLLIAGPHIGYHNGSWGKVPRPGQKEITISCGSLSAIITAGYEKIINKPSDHLDRQQQTIEQLMLPYLKTCNEDNKAPNVIEGTKYLMVQVDRDLKSILQNFKNFFNGKIAVITGITINTELGNYFSVSTFDVLEKAKDILTQIL